MKYIPQRPPLGRLTVAATSCWFVGFQSLLESSPTPFDLTQIGRWLPSIWFHKFVNKCVIEIGVIWNHKLLAGNAVGTTMDSFLVTDSYWYVIDPWFKRPMVCQARPPMSMTRSEQWWLAEENKRNFSWDDLQRWSPIIPSPYYPLISNPPWLPRGFWKLHPVVCWSSVILAPARMDNKKCFKTPTAPTHLWYLWTVLGFLAWSPCFCRWNPFIGLKKSFWSVKPGKSQDCYSLLASYGGGVEARSELSAGHLEVLFTQMLWCKNGYQKQGC